jgi:hypothetical protein
MLYTIPELSARLLQVGMETYSRPGVLASNTLYNRGYISVKIMQPPVLHIKILFCKIYRIILFDPVISLSPLQLKDTV